MKKEKILSKQRVLKGPVFDVNKLRVRIPSGAEATFVLVDHPGAVVIIAQHADGKLVLERQWRRAIKASIVEFPAGTLEKGEDPLEAAKRELAEETGLNAASWTELGVLYPAPGFCNEKQFGFFARKLSPTPAALDEDEQIEVLTASVAKVERMFARGEVQDGKSLAFFQRARALKLL